MYSDEFGRAPKKFGSSNYAKARVFLSSRRRARLGLQIALLFPHLARCTLCNVNFGKRDAWSNVAPHIVDRIVPPESEFPSLLASLRAL
jgi:hypothetical protein